MEPRLDGKVREALAMFADEKSAHRYLERVLWPDGVCCPRCGSAARVRRLEGASTRLGAYKCYRCRKAFSLLHGTVMRSSHVPAHKRLQAMYLTQGSAKPMRAHQLGSHPERVVQDSGVDDAPHWRRQPAVCAWLREKGRRHPARRWVMLRYYAQPTVPEDDPGGG